MADAPPPDAASAAGTAPQAADGGSSSPAGLPSPDPSSPPVASPAGPSARAGVNVAPSALPHSSALPDAVASGAPPSPHAPAPPLPQAQLPVVDLIGLRFSLQHLRLVGYGLLAVWGSEIVNLLTSPKLAEIGTRLHYTSQFLDLSPILLVAIGLIAFQGGLRRRPLELAVLPLLLALLPLLSAFHFFLAPVSAANVITLVQKQQQIGLDQIEKIDEQIDRAASILRESDSIDTLLQGLERIPGLQVRVPAKASVTEARQEVRRSLERERDRLRERIEGNLSASRDAFLRRAITNALLALVVGLLLWGLHHGAMREMEQAIPFLDWVLVQGDAPQQPEALQELLHFQRACVSLGWFSLLERCLRLVRRVVKRPTAAQLVEEEQERQRQAQDAWAQMPSNPFERPLPQAARLGSAPPSLFSRFLPFPDVEPPAGPDDGEAQEPDPLDERIERSRAASQRREDRRRLRDMERYRALRRRIEREGSDPFAIFSSDDPEPELGPAGAAHTRPELVEGPAAQSSPDHSPSELAWFPDTPADLSPQALRRLERDHRRSREALHRMGTFEDLGWRGPEEERFEGELQEEIAWQRQLSQRLPPPAPPRRQGLAGLWHWFLSHL